MTTWGHIKTLKTTSNITDSASIPIGYSRLIARELGLQEKSLKGLLLGTGLDDRCLMRDDTLLTAQQQVQVVRNALRLSGDESFGLRLGKLLTPPTHGPLGFLANSSPNLQIAVDAFQNFLPSRISFARMESDHSDLWLECRLYVDFEAEEPIYRSIIEAFSLALLSMMEFVLGRPVTEGHLFCRYPEPSYGKDYSRYLSCPVSFSAPESKLQIPVALCDTPNASSDHANYGFALQQCQAMLQQLPTNSGATSHRIQALMLSHPPGQLNEEAAAAALFISKRTLARRLAKEGTGFRQLKEEMLSTLAAGYLRDTQISVEAIAGLLNYHDSANFRRAFKRWYQISPKGFRQQ